jgi:hypothetical protein
MNPEALRDRSSCAHLLIGLRRHSREVSHVYLSEVTHLIS